VDAADPEAHDRGREGAGVEASEEEGEELWVGG
jgi:hypothetical protein